ncbi:endonuclease/exonuclease/phosphatase family protein [Mycolicibacterium stellerae]|uniref:endonuclease/exonuclease/phosphatase family protein n=1 Tax=Mycolicibacterium stellerae TaxID=2358193 RepID=UPI000F0BB431|nr:endonuclease/exonuclease/phosphatase family protein [Mycolicibacterium stellerae]
MRLLPRRRGVRVEKFDVATGRWAEPAASGGADRDELTLATYNVWNDPKYFGERYLAIAQLLSRHAPDIMVFQEITPPALDVFVSQQWIRDGYSRASVVGGDAGSYGMLLLSRLPLSRVTYTRLPSRQSRGFLQAELTLNGRRLVVCCIHLDSGKASSRLRGWQLRRIFGALKMAEDAVVLGDFNMRDAEDSRIAAPYRDVWPTLRPGEDGFTEDTSINLMRYDMKDKHRHVRFDRVLLKGRQWSAANIELLGTKPIAADLPRVFPSDHFGVKCLLTTRNP